MKRIHIGIILSAIMSLLLLSACSSLPSKKQISLLSDQEAERRLVGISQQQIKESWGEPDSSLSGFYGDISNCEDKNIIIYYDQDSKVNNVRIWTSQP